MDVRRFFGEVRVELARVEWPHLQEFLGATIVVLFIVAVFAVYLKFADSGIEWVITQIITRGF